MERCRRAPPGTPLLLLALLLLSPRMARSEEDREGPWDVWGPWSECSRTCGGGASYSLRRCLSSRSCEGRNIRYRTCSNVDCPLEAGDFRAQQCSAHNDVKHHGQFYEWLPVSNDPDNPCSLKCQAKGTALVVELAPKVLDGTRCYSESLDMCISGLCQIVGCDHQLGSTAKEDNCGVCNGDGSTCRLVRGQYKSQLSATTSDDTVVAIPYGSRHVRLVLKGPDHLYLETKTLHGAKGENSLSSTGTFLVDNSSVDFQKLPDKEILRMTGPLMADFIIKIQNSGPADSTVQFIFHQPIIHRWRETDFFPCSATCGGGKDVPELHTAASAVIRVEWSAGKKWDRWGPSSFPDAAKSRNPWEGSSGEIPHKLLCLESPLEEILYFFLDFMEHPNTLTRALS